MPDSDKQRGLRTQIGVAPTAQPSSFSGLAHLDTEGTFVSVPPNPASGADLSPGTIINQYELIRELGRGGMGVVYTARDRQLGRRVAIKFLRDVSEEVGQRFMTEAQATAQCSHENIVIIYEVNSYEGMPFMVLELLDGFPLRQLMGEWGEGNILPASRVVELILPVARGLACAHDAGIVHRDLKPENIQVTHGGQVKVLDFGIAKAQPSDARAKHRPLPNASLHLTSQGTLVGTLPYMSPEQMQGSELDARSDVFALGVIMFEMLAGKHPIETLTSEAMFENLVSPAPMRSARTIPDVPFELADLIDRCLAKPRGERPAAHDIARALEAQLPDRRGRRLAEGESPYPGLTAFQETDADRFFGRSRDIARMATRIRELPLTAVVGPSGVGKSSFVRAGVGPALKSSGERWDIITIRPGRQPLAALISLAERAFVSASGSSTRLPPAVGDDTRLERIRREPGFLATMLREQARAVNGNILVFVDQFEELYTLVPDPAERHAFTAALAAIADDVAAPLRVVVSMRSDLLDRAGDDARFMEELTRGMVFLAPPDRDGLREALVAPVEMVGYRFESSELVEDILGALAETAGALPLLQFAAGKLWDARSRERRLLTVESYRAIGGITGALATHADDVIASMSSSQRMLTRTILRQLVTPERTRAIAELTDLQELSADAGETMRIVDQLVGARLLVVQNRDAGSSVEIVHESLIMSWPTLRRWLDDDAEDAQFRAQLAAAAKQWDAKQRAPGLLWRGDAMTEAKRWFDAGPREMSPRDHAFLDAVFAVERSARRRRRIYQITGFVLLSSVAAIFMVATFKINKERQDAEEARKDATVNMEKAERALADKLAAEGGKRAADARASQADMAKSEAETSQQRIKQQLDQTLEQQKKTLEQKNAELERKAAEAIVQKQNAERAMADAKKLAETLSVTKTELEQKLAAEKRRAEDAERRAKGLSKELK